MDKDEARRFGHLLKRRRGELGLSTHDLGKLVGTRNSTIMRIEQGAFAAPRPDKLARIAEALHLSLADVYARAGYIVPAELPTFREYLAARYRELPDLAAGELARLFDELMIRHGLGTPAFEVAEATTDETFEEVQIAAASTQPGGVIA
ncbi:MAG TPA: helix-turn-helix transcriptional regulator [Acidimicrobiales bacterium]|nr:helix-turn-helix transcriptional regulator [Acidimicrobiales bacterium]